ncbi:hypothetical protein HBE96_00385 [Clostridium sp. P21]|uniref:Uncharacterized protein n=1 Tax=Clostridium muellerianum TaxID=2716538 RepID=A0A7Y0HKR2_9CLOT|nr:hypothetical protein [Clostridium muellerianum]NMM61184.1 hypothetical protein [Clostridium muellerianum]
MINNRETEQIWKEALKDIEENMKNDVAITIDNDNLRGNLINIFSIFDNISYEIDNERTEECKRILYKDEYFEAIKYLLKDYKISFVMELIDSMKHFYKRLCENVEGKEIFVTYKKANNMYHFIELMFTEKIVKTLFRNNIVEHLFFVQDNKNRLNKAVFINNIDALSVLYNKLADERGIPEKFRKKIVLDNIR